MALLQLIGRLGLDTSNFEQNLKQSENTAAAFGNKFRRSIVSSVGSFFTLGYAINAVTDRISKLNSEGADFAIPTGELSESIEAQEAAIRGGEQRLAQRQEIAKLEHQLSDQMRENTLKGLSDDEKRLALMREMGLIMEELATTKLDSINSLRLLNDYEKLRGQMLGIKQDKEPSPMEFKATTSQPRVLDPLARIGGLGARGDTRLATYMERTAKATEETANNTGKAGVRFR